MSETAPPEVYVYQPFNLSDPIRVAAGRLYGVSGLGVYFTCEGLTQPEAIAIAKTLNTLHVLRRAEMTDAD